MSHLAAEHARRHGLAGWFGNWPEMNAFFPVVVHFRQRLGQGKKRKRIRTSFIQTLERCAAWSSY
jgi:hypothetical protein